MLSLRPALVCLAAAVWFAPCAATAQTSASDGARALVLGDYQTAARIFRPLAEDTQKPDALAQFFLALMYDSGQGVPADQFQACALFVSAAQSANPLMRQSLVLAHAIENQSPMAAQLCSLAAADDDRLLHPVSFTLGSDHTVRVDRTGVTVSYQGTEKRTTMMMGDQDSVFLPVLHTNLTVTRPVPARRDFIQYFVWRPGNIPDQASWTLGWALFEVVGADFLHVVAEDILTVSAVEPAAVSDVSSLVQLRVNRDGEVEWVISGR